MYNEHVIQYYLALCWEAGRKCLYHSQFIYYSFADDERDKQCKSNQQALFPPAS